MLPATTLLVRLCGPLERAPAVDPCLPDVDPCPTAGDWEYLRIESAWANPHVRPPSDHHDAERRPHGRAHRRQAVLHPRADVRKPWAVSASGRKSGKNRLVRCHAYRPNPEKDLVKIAGSDAARGGRDARVSKTTRHARRGHVSQDGLSAKACMFVRP